MTFPARNSCRHPWTGRPHVTALTINRLARGRRHGPESNRIAGNTGACPAKTKLEIVERTDGVPLFVEEMTRAVLEGRGARRAGNCAPETVVLFVRRQGPCLRACMPSLTGRRLDRLGESQGPWLRTGAAIGREFSHELLALVARGTSGELAAITGSPG